VWKDFVVATLTASSLKWCRNLQTLCGRYDTSTDSILPFLNNNVYTPLHFTEISEKSELSHLDADVMILQCDEGPNVDQK
jgi:hypothetical protein